MKHGDFPCIVKHITPSMHISEPPRMSNRIFRRHILHISLNKISTFGFENIGTFRKLPFPTLGLLLAFDVAVVSFDVWGPGNADPSKHPRVMCAVPLAPTESSWIAPESEFTVASSLAVTAPNGHRQSQLGYYTKVHFRASQRTLPVL